MRTKKRGFDALVGKTIVKINASAINVVTITDSEGNIYEITSEAHPIGIPVIVLEKRK